VYFLMRLRMLVLRGRLGFSFCGMDDLRFACWRALMFMRGCKGKINCVLVCLICKLELNWEIKSCRLG